MSSSDSAPSVESRPPPAAGQEPGAESDKKSETRATIARNSFWLLLDSIASGLAQILSSIMVARSLGPDRMGEYNYLIVFASVIKMLTEVAMPQTFRKFAAEYTGRGDYGTVKTMVRRAQRFQIKLVVLGVSVGLGIVYFVFRPEQRLLGTLAVLSIVPSIFIGVTAAALWATENLRYNVQSSLAAMLVNLTGVTLSVVMHWGLMGLILSLLGSRVFDCVLRYLLFRWRYSLVPGEPSDRLDPVLLKRMSRFAVQQLAMTLLSALLFERMEVFFLKSLAKATREIAFFSISFNFVQQLLILPQTLAGAASVTMMVRQGRSPKEAARIAATATWFTILIAGPTLFGVASISSPLLRVMYDVRYVPAIPVLSTMAIFGLSLAASQSAQFLLMAAERQGYYIGCMLVAGLVDVLGNSLLIPSMGALGAAYSKGTSQLIAAIGFIGFAILRLHAPLPLGRIVKLVTSCVIMFGAVRLVVHYLPPLPGLGLGIPVGATVFVMLMRWLRCLDKDDGDRLRHLERMLPGPVRRPYDAVIAFLIPAEPASVPSPAA
jgi:O-antigen/teichoic acid export membrane protein